MEPTRDPGFLAFLPLIIMSLGIAVASHLLARDKGRNVTLWTILGLIPLLNFAFIWFFIGASNLRVERKLDELLSRVQSRS